MKLEEGVAIASGPMAQVRAFDDRPRLPRQLTSSQEQCLEVRCGEGRVGKGRHHAWGAVAVLAEDRRLIARHNGSPIRPLVRRDGMHAESTRHSVSNYRAGDDVVDRYRTR